MAEPTIRDNLSFCLREADYPLASNTLLVSRRQSVGAATRPEQPGYVQLLRPSSATPTVIYHEETTSTIKEYQNPFERYRVLNRLCTGAEAQIFLAERLHDKQSVILKIYHDGITPEPGVLERVLLSSGEHVVKLHEYGKTGASQAFEVQDYVRCGVLSELFCSHPLPDNDCKLILQQVTEAIAHLHTQDTEGRYVIHRDIKPANILIKAKAPLDLVLCDFGIASLIGGERVPAPGRRDCTPRYAAPETFSGLVTSKSDYWSLGIIILEALQGCHPFEGVPEDRIETLHRNGWQPDLSALESEDWRQLLAGLTHRSPEERWGYKEIRQWLKVDLPGESLSKAEEDLLETFDWLSAGSIQELAVQLVRSWPRGSAILDDSLFQRFLSAELARMAPDLTIAEILDKTGDMNDIRLLRLIYRLCPAFPHFWKEWLIQRPELTKICRRAVAGDLTLQRLTEELVGLNVLKELAKVTGDEELSGRADKWHNALSEYLQLKELMERRGAPDGLFPDRGSAAAMLYLMACENSVGLALNEEADLTALLLFSFPWLHPLNSQAFSLSPANRLIRSFVLPHCIELQMDNFHVKHDNREPIFISSEPVFNLGWNPPTIALSAAYIDFEMTLCQKKKSIAKGVRLKWEVRRAAIIVLSGFGFVRSEGALPNERMASGAVYQFINNCNCDDHAANWFTLTETTSFSLTAIGAGGITVHRLPPIVVAKPELEPQAALTVPIPMLLPQAGLTVPVKQLAPQLCFSVGATGADDLEPQMAYTVPLLNRNNLSPQAVFKEFSDAQLRCAIKNRLI